MTSSAHVAMATEKWEGGDTYVVLGIDEAHAMQALAEVCGYSDAWTLGASGDFAIWVNEQPINGPLTRSH